MTEIVKGAWAKNSEFFHKCIVEEMLIDSQHFFFRMDVLSIQNTVFFTVASFKHRLPAVFETLLSPDDFFKSSNVFYFALFSCFMDSSVFDILHI